LNRCKAESQFPSSWNQADADRFSLVDCSTRPELRLRKWIVDHSQPGQCALSMWKGGALCQGMKDGRRKACLTFSFGQDVRWDSDASRRSISIVKKPISPRMTKSLIRVVGPAQILLTMAAIQSGRRRRGTGLIFFRFCASCLPWKFMPLHG